MVDRSSGGGHLRGERSSSGGDSGRAAMSLVVLQLTRSQTPPSKLAGMRGATPDWKS